jgi:hypothetical protein
MADGSATGVELRVLLWNVWLLPPCITDNRVERPRLIAQYLAQQAGKWDVVSAC